MTPSRVTLALVLVMVAVLLAAGCALGEQPIQPEKTPASVTTLTNNQNTPQIPLPQTKDIPSVMETEKGNSNPVATPLPARAKYVPGEVIVRYNGSLSSEQFIQISTALNDQMGEKNPTNASVSRMPYVQLVHLPSNISVESAIAFYEKNESVDWAQPDYIYSAITTL